MKPRQLGQTGIELSPLGLGTVKFGRNQGVKYPESFEIPGEPFLADLLTLAKDLGINALDTAPAYGESEERLGRLLKGQRDDWVIIGKAGENFIDGQSKYNFTPAHFEQSLENSLKKLGTDYLDIFLIHSDGNDMEILNNDALITKMQDFKSRGLVRAIGASTKTLEGGIKTLELMDVAMCTYTQTYTDESGVLNYAAANNKGILLKKVLGSGHLAKKDLSTESGDKPVDNSVNSSLEAALEFTFDHSAVTSAIIGTINPDHLRSNAKILEKILEKSLSDG